MPAHTRTPAATNVARRVTLLGLAAVVGVFVASWLTVPAPDRPRDEVGFPARLFTSGLAHTEGGDEIMQELDRDHPSCQRNGLTPPRFGGGCLVPTGLRDPTYQVVDRAALRERIQVVSGGTAIVVVLVGLAFGAARRSPQQKDGLADV